MYSLGSGVLKMRSILELNASYSELYSSSASASVMVSVKSNKNLREFKLKWKRTFFERHTVCSYHQQLYRLYVSQTTVFFENYTEVPDQRQSKQTSPVFLSQIAWRLGGRLLMYLHGSVSSRMKGIDTVERKNEAIKISATHKLESTFNDWYHL